MDWSELGELELNTDLASVAAGLEGPARQPQFVLGENRFLRIQAKNRLKASRRGVKALIQPENARCVIPHLPEPGEHTHAVLRGDFVLCDLIPAVIQARGPAGHLHIATLGLSAANADQLVQLKAGAHISDITVLCSHYFQQVDKTTVFREVAAKLREHGRLVVARNHAKVICLPTRAGDAYVIEGSANLRSSDNLEQVTLFNDPELLAWHVEWIEQLTRRHG